MNLFFLRSFEAILEGLRRVGGAYWLHFARLWRIWAAFVWILLRFCMIFAHFQVFGIFFWDLLKFEHILTYFWRIFSYFGACLCVFLSIFSDVFSNACFMTVGSHLGAPKLTNSFGFKAAPRSGFFVKFIATASLLMRFVDFGQLLKKKRRNKNMFYFL